MKLKLCLLAATMIPSIVNATDWSPLDERLKNYRPYLSASVGVAEGLDSKDAVGIVKYGLGIKIGSRIAIEANGIKTGEMVERVMGQMPAPRPGMDDTPGQGIAYNRRTQEIEGYGVGVVGYFPLNSMTRAIVRADVYRVSVDALETGLQGDFNTVADPAKPITDAPDKNGSEKTRMYSVGLGVERKLAINTFIRGQFEYYTPSLVNNDEEEVEDFFSLNLQLIQRL